MGGQNQVAVDGGIRGSSTKYHFSKGGHFREDGFVIGAGCLSLCMSAAYIRSSRTPLYRHAFLLYCAPYKLTDREDMYDQANALGSLQTDFVTTLINVSDTRASLTKRLSIPVRDNAFSFLSSPEAFPT
jgi:hypothetical protein